jgi:hypothetical protein
MLIEEQLSDSRQGLNKQFTLADLLRQSVYSRATRTSTTPSDSQPTRLVTHRGPSTNSVPISLADLPPEI